MRTIGSESDMSVKITAGVITSPGYHLGGRRRNTGQGEGSTDAGETLSYLTVWLFCPHLVKNK